MRKLVLLFLLLLIFINFSNAQSPNIPVEYQRQALTELSKRGLTEAEVRERLLAEGIDIDNVTLEELPQLQQTIERIIAELEATKVTAPKENLIKEEATEEVMPTINKTTPTPVASSPSPTVIKNQQPPTPLSRRGQAIFAAANKQDIKNQVNNNVSQTYILDTGDELTITIFGKSQLDARFKIDASGYIKPSNMPRISLKGITYSAAKELLRDRYAIYYTFRKEQFLVSLVSPRSMAIEILGEVNNLGTFNLSGQHTIIDALKIAGGPNAIGSLRNVKLIRGKTTLPVDIYTYINDPSMQYDYYLQSGDIIHVPFATKIIEIEGAVTKPMLYELKEKEDLIELIQFAGGLKADAYQKTIRLERFEEDEAVIIDINLQELKKNKRNYSLQNGDKIIIRTISADKDNFVTIEGAVEFAGTYALDNTPRVSDLLKKGMPQEEARLDAAFLTRQNVDGSTQLIELALDSILATPHEAADILLERKDKLTIYQQERFVDAATITIKGAVRNAMEHPYGASTTITLKQALLLAGGLRPDAYEYGYISRRNLENPEELAYIPVNLKAAVNNPNSADNITLLPFDELTVLTNSTFEDVAMVSISGAIRQPGKFRYHESLTVKDVFTLSGGFKLGAALNRIEVFRLVLEENTPTRTIATTLQVDSLFQSINGMPINLTLQPFDEIVVRSIPEFELQKFVTIEGEVAYPGKYAILKDNEAIASIIKRSGGLTLEAFPEGANLFRMHQGKEILLVTKLDQVLGSKYSKYNYLLQDGDRIVVPKNKKFVSIQTANTKAKELYPDRHLTTGEIYIAYDQGKRANWYIKEYAAGFGERAARKNVTVEYPSGELKRTKNFLFFKHYPLVENGAIISIGAKPPEQKKKPKKERAAINWEKVFANTFQALTLGVTTVLLVQRL